MVYDQAMEHLNGITVKPTKATGKTVWKMVSAYGNPLKMIPTRAIGC